jgi:predicted nucleic acid-binding protein
VLVVDTSAVLAALLARDPAHGLVERLAADGDLHAPHLLDVELLHALRRLVGTAAISHERAIDARSDFDDLALTRYPHHELADRIWELRHNVTAYDATFIALAEALDTPLVTCDASLASAPAHGARVDLFATE